MAAFRRKRSEFVIFRSLTVLGIVCLGSVFYGRRVGFKGPEAHHLDEISNDHGSPLLLRRLLAISTNSTIDSVGVPGQNDSTTANSDNESFTLPTHETFECTAPAYHEFPPDVFTTRQRENGALALHVIMVIYMFVALALVCDDYFVASLDKICEKLNMSEDVAGATFMAAGSSAPELFTSIIGVFVAKGDVGVGTIVGSAVFNILFVIGICGVLVSQVVILTWFPLLRDSSFYSLSVVILIASIADSAVQWYEAAIMLSLYIIYIVVMKFNVPIQKWAVARIHIFGSPKEDDTDTILPPASERKYYTSNSYEMFRNENDAKSVNDHQPVIPVDEYVLKSTRKISFEDACFRFMKGRRFRPLTRYRAAAYIIILERRKLLNDATFMRRQKLKTLSYDSDATSYTKAMRNGHKDQEGPFPSDEWYRLPNLNEGLWYLSKWVFTFPINILLYYTIPDCRRKRWDRWFFATFCMSIVWIAVFSYIMVWMVALIGYTLGVPDSIMGITFLAAGTSVPDAMASVMVARQGQGDMAISNTIGSNVFDILIGLALPWGVQTAIVAPGSSVHINSNGMVFSVVLLFLTVIITIMAIHFGGWRLDKRVGVICLISYAIFLIISILIEFNVFGYVNPPMCPEPED